MSQPVQSLSDLEAEARRAVSEAASANDLAQVRARFLGRKGSLSGLLRGIGALPPDERGPAGQQANALKARIEGWVRERREALERAAHAEVLSSHALDVTLPGWAPPAGHLHPVTRIEREVVAFFASMGFSIEEGPEVETEHNNFEALNIPADHPAREMQATFFVEGGQVLRTHTSNVQIRAMTGREPPFRFIAPGRVYRHDRSLRHFPMFHQVEGFMVDERVSFGDLKGVLFAFARQMLGDDVDLRFRSSYFPFTEPSAEIDFSCLVCGARGCGTCSQTGWVEWGGCGMIHPQVLENCGIDAERWQGFAFGMGLDRTAMLRWGVPNISLFFEGDVRVLEQF